MCEIEWTIQKRVGVVFSVILSIVLAVILGWLYWPSSSPSSFQFKGVNSYYLYSCPTEYQSLVLYTMKQKGMTHLRIFLNKYQDEGYPGECGNIQDVEYPLGIFHSDVILKINEFLLLARTYNIKIIVSLHDRWSLGCWRKDAYVQAFNLSIAQEWGKSCPSPELFYFDPRIQSAFKTRLNYLLHVTVPGLNGTQWKNFDTIDMFEAQNEPQYGSSIFNIAWDCQMASFLKQITTTKITNGATFLPTSFACDSIDVHSIHDYNSFESYLAQWTLARPFKKPIVLQEFSYDYAKVKWSNDHDTSWMLWNVDQRNTSTSISLVQLKNTQIF